MTVGDVIADARQNLMDVEGTAWDGPVLIEHVAKAVREVVTRRPDFLLLADGTLADEDAVCNVDAEGDEISLPAKVAGAVMLFVCHWALLRDSDDRANLDRALAYRTVAERSLGVGG